MSEPVLWIDEQNALKNIHADASGCVIGAHSDKREKDNRLRL